MGALPPLVGVAVKVTLVPVHTVVVGVLILIAGVTLELTEIVIVLLLALALPRQLALEVISQVKLSPLASADVV